MMAERTTRPRTALHLLAIAAVMSIVYACFLFAKPILKIIGSSNINVIQRIVGLMLAAISCQMIMSGVEKAVTAYKHTAETKAAGALAA